MHYLPISHYTVISNKTLKIHCPFFSLLQSLEAQKKYVQEQPSGKKRKKK